MHCTWLGCIRSCTKYPSHEFLANRWFIHNWFVDLSKTFKIIVHYLLIGGIVGLDYQDEVLMVSALMNIVTHWTRSMMSNDIWLSSSHDFTKLLYYIISQLWENIKLVSKFVVTLIYGWDPKVIIYSLWIGSLLMKVGSNSYSQYRHHDIVMIEP